MIAMSLRKPPNAASERMKYLRWAFGSLRELSWLYGRFVDLLKEGGGRNLGCFKKNSVFRWEYMIAALMALCHSFAFQHPIHQVA